MQFFLVVCCVRHKECPRLCEWVSVVIIIVTSLVRHCFFLKIPRRPPTWGAICAHPCSLHVRSICPQKSEFPNSNLEISNRTPLSVTISYLKVGPVSPTLSWWNQHGTVLSEHQKIIPDNNVLIFCVHSNIVVICCPSSTHSIIFYVAVSMCTVHLWL